MNWTGDRREAAVLVRWGIGPWSSWPCGLSVSSGLREVIESTGAREVLGSGERRRQLELKLTGPRTERTADPEHAADFAPLSLASPNRRTHPSTFVHPRDAHPSASSGMESATAPPASLHSIEASSASSASSYPPSVPVPSRPSLRPLPFSHPPPPKRTVPTAGPRRESWSEWAYKKVGDSFGGG